MKARDIMTQNPDFVTPDERLTRAAQIMRDRDVGSVPVLDSGDSKRLEGVITDRDIAIRHVADEHGNDCVVEHHMSADALRTVAPDDDVDKVLETMKQSQVRRVPVVESGNRLVGIIAQADVAREGIHEQEVSRVVEQVSEPE